MKIDLKGLPKLPQMAQVTRSLRPVLRRHYFITLLGMLACLIVAVYMVGRTLQMPSDEAYRSEKMSSGISAGFDQATITKVERLQRSSDNPAAQPNLPVGTRTNPFAE